MQLRDNESWKPTVVFVVVVVMTLTCDLGALEGATVPQDILAGT